MSSDWDLAGDRTIFTTSGSYATEESACPLIHHGLASVMAQHRVGNCQIGYEGRLDFQFAGKHVLSLSENERNFIPRRKVGSR